MSAVDGESPATINHNLTTEFSRDESTLSERIGDDSISDLPHDDDFDNEILQIEDLEDLEESLGLGRGGWWVHPNKLGFPYDPHTSEELFPTRSDLQDLKIWMRTPFNDTVIQDHSDALLNQINSLIDAKQQSEANGHLLAPQFSHQKPPLHNMRRESPVRIKGKNVQRNDTYLKRSQERFQFNLQKPSLDQGDSSLNSSLDRNQYKRLARRDTFQLNSSDGGNDMLQFSHGTYNFGSLERSIADETIAEEDERTPGTKLKDALSPGFRKNRQNRLMPVLNPRRCTSPDSPNNIYRPDPMLTRTYSNEAIKNMKDGDHYIPDIYTDESVNLSKSLNLGKNMLRLPDARMFTKNTNSNVSSLRSSQESIKDMAKSQEEQLRASVPDKYKKRSPSNSAAGSQDDLRSSNPNYDSLKKALNATQELKKSNELRRSAEKNRKLSGRLNVPTVGSSYDSNKMNRSYDSNDPYMIARMQEENLRASSQGKYSSSRNSSNSSRNDSRENILTMSQELGDSQTKRAIDMARDQEEELRFSAHKYASSRDSSLRGSYDLNRQDTYQPERKHSNTQSENLFFGKGVEQLIDNKSGSYDLDQRQPKHQLSVITAEALDMSVDSNISQSVKLAQQQEELLRSQTQNILMKTSIRRGSRESVQSSQDDVKRSFELQRPLKGSYDLADRNMKLQNTGSQENLNLRGSYELNKPKMLQQGSDGNVRIRDKPQGQALKSSYDIAPGKSVLGATTTTRQYGQRNRSGIPAPRNVPRGQSGIPRPGTGRSGSKDRQNLKPNLVTPASPSQKLPTQSKTTNRYK